MAQPFDASRLELSGGPIALPAAPSWAGNSGFYGFSASATGVLAYSAASNVGPATIGLGRSSRGGGSYDVSLDSQRFLMTEPVATDGEAAGSADSSVRLITNWPAKYAPEQ